MNPYRIIKLKQLNDELENLTPEEQLFFDLHNKLQEYSNGILCNDEGFGVVEYDFKNGKFWYSNGRFYLFFKLNFGINIQEFEDLCKSILIKHLNYKELLPSCNYLPDIYNKYY